MSKAAFIFLAILGYACCQDFDRNNVGVSFSPYTKHWENGQIPYWNSYSLEDIKIMLRLISQKFTSISTYGMGVADYNNGQPWDQCDSNCLVSRAAAQINRDRGQKVISVNQGVNQLPDPTLQREIDNAFSAAEDANSIYGGTVWGITFTNEYIVDQSTGQRVLGMLRNNKDKAHARGLKIGTRSHICGEIYNPGGLQSLFNDITRESDYIMCNLYPANKDVNGGIPAAVKAVGDYYFYLREGFRAINPNIDVIIGETGWPSEGHSFNDSPNSIQNLKDYWIQMGQWASQNGVKVQLFEAIDEPWKNDENNLDPNNPGGKFGAEAHYGWWKRLSNADPNSYVEK